MRKVYDKKTLKTAQEEKGKRAENKTENIPSFRSP